jgi:hypothetical protein
MGEKIREKKQHRRSEMRMKEEENGRTLKRCSFWDDEKEKGLERETKIDLFCSEEVDGTLSLRFEVFHLVSLEFHCTLNELREVPARKMP